jgi:biotin carboxylase/SAM-dependent methyltransferase
MDNTSGSVIVVDGYSSGAFYVPLLEKHSIPAVHVRSLPESLNCKLTDVADQALKRWGPHYAAMIDGSADLDDVLRRLKAYSPRALLVGCESGVELADTLAHALGLPGNDLARSHARRDKYLMHRALQQAGLRALKSILSDNLQTILHFLEADVGYPAVLKPPRSSGADGVHICRTPQEVERAFVSLAGSPSLFGEPITHVLAQEFAPGEEVVVNTVSHEGKHRLSDLWRYSKIITADGRSVYDGAELVSDFGESTREIIDYAFATLDALGIGFGPAHMEIMHTPSGPVLIECGSRPMGGSFPQDLLRESQQRTQLELCLEAALEPEAFLKRLHEPYTLRKHFLVKCLMTNRAGRLAATPGVTLLTALPSVRSGNFLHCLEAERLDRTVDLLSSPAHLYLCHENPAVVHEDHALIHALEQEGETLLFELAPEDDAGIDPEWFKRIPDELWLMPEDESEASAAVIWRALRLAPAMEMLDCPCGDGRVSVHLALRGATVTGVDINPRFIHGARERFARGGVQGEFHVRDMRELDFEDRFDVVLNWFNSFGYFDIETDFEVLKRLGRALRPGGLLAIEAPNRVNVLANIRTKQGTDGEEYKPRWDELSEKVFLPITIEQEGRTTVVLASDRMYSLAEYRLLFRLAGLDFRGVLNEEGNEFDVNSKRMILLARKP